MLPAAKRSDVEMEIRSLLQDEVDAQPGGASEENTIAALRKFGSPAAIAARYGATQHLIGPALYPGFLLVLRIVLSVIFGLTLFGMMVAVWAQKAPFAPLSMLTSMFASMLQAAAMVVIVFAIIERVTQARGVDAAGDWNPRSLPAVVNVGRINWSEMVFELAFGTVFIVLLNFYVESLAGYWSNGEWNAFPLFSQEFLAFVPWITALWAWEVLVKVIVMLRGRWEPVTRILDLLSSVMSFTLLSWMLRADQLAAWAPLEPVFKVILAVALVIVAVDFVRNVWNLVTQIRGSAPAPFPAPHQTL